MLSYVFDTSARATCRSFGAVFGHSPFACQTNGGRPFLILIAGASMLLFCLFLAIRAYRAKA